MLPVTVRSQLSRMSGVKHDLLLSHGFLSAQADRRELAPAVVFHIIQLNTLAGLGKLPGAACLPGGPLLASRRHLGALVGAVQWCVSLSLFG